MKGLLTPSLMLFLLATNASAAEGEICLAAATRIDSISQKAVTNDTVFDCQAAGKKTIPQLYKAGWRVVVLMPQAVMDASGPIVRTSWTIVIEKI
ncbi:MAG TPA: hypothetical protein VIN36_10805 [Thiobacillus sp.]